MPNSIEKLHYIRYEIGDIVKERPWVMADSGTLYGIIVYIDRLAYAGRDWLTWLAYADDRVHVYWFKWGSMEQLPASMIEIVSSIDSEGGKNE